MSRYILTGAPGAGKIAVLRLLEFNGHVVAEEAATDIIALESRGRIVARYAGGCDRDRRYRGSDGFGVRSKISVQPTRVGESGGVASGQ